VSINPDNLARQLDALELLLRQLGAEQNTRLERFFAGMMEAHRILGQRVEHVEDMILALDNRLTAVEAMREERNAVH
jgi:hypothetical protein